MKFFIKISRLDTAPGKKFNFTYQKILELYPWTKQVQVLNFFGPGPGTGLKGLTVELKNEFNFKIRKFTQTVKLKSLFE